MCGGEKHFDCTEFMVNTDGDLDLTELTFIIQKKDKKNKLSMFIHSKWFSWRTLTCNHLQDCVLCFLDCQRLVVRTQRS